MFHRFSSTFVLALLLLDIIFC